MSSIFEFFGRKSGCTLDCAACDKDPDHCGSLRHRLVRLPDGRVLSLCECFPKFLKRANAKGREYRPDWDLPAGCCTIDWVDGGK